eukprot:scaffold10613_cov77-Cylindrotheca_fusiformis.AAC.1
MTSQRIVPPKILTRIALTCGSAVMISNAAAICSVVADPPTSKKFAGDVHPSITLEAGNAFSAGYSCLDTSSERDMANTV